MSETVGFIGLGNIGYPMAKNIVTSFAGSCVYDMNPKPVEKLAAKGAIACETPAELAQKCSVIGICVRNDADVEQLLYGDTGLLKQCQKDSVIAIHSTVTENSMKRWYEEGQAVGIHIVDAPITGGADGARDKTLCYMVGSSEQVLDRLAPVLETSAKRVVHAGVAGKGTVLKLCNNLMNYMAFTAVDEGLRLAEKGGLEPELIYQVGEVNGIVTQMMRKFAEGRNGLKPVCSEEDFNAVFMPFAELAEKDLDAALDVAKENGTQLPATEAVRKNIQAVFLKTHD